MIKTLENTNQNGSIRLMKKRRSPKNETQRGIVGEPKKWGFIQVKTEPEFAQEMREFADANGMEYSAFVREAVKAYMKDLREGKPRHVVIPPSTNDLGKS